MYVVRFVILFNVLGVCLLGSVFHLFFVISEKMVLVVLNQRNSIGTFWKFQAIFFVLIRPLSKNAYRRINRELAELLWLELVWLIDWWAGVKVNS